MVEVGRLALWVALLASGAALLAGLRASRPGGGTGSRWLGLAVGAAAVAAGRLAWALLTNDYTLTYVADFARRDASAPYRLAALWGGMAGSLLWFATLIGAAGWWAARRVPDVRVRGRMVAVTGGLLAALIGLVLGFADPFRRLAVPALDGSGLTPILEHPAMLYHPPLLYLGLATLTGPFALTVAALAGPAPSGGSVDLVERWQDTVRRWLAVPWVLLAVGMVAGAHWAYVELGWGGYWAWDPVENTALLPWLAVTLALHAHHLRRHDRPAAGVDRGLAALVCLAFVLALVGAMLTRSGAVSSVHAFAESRAIGRALGVLAGAVLVGVAVLLLRHRGRSDGRRSAVPFRRRPLGALLLAHLAIVGTVLAVAVTGTLAPLVTDLRGGDGIAIEGRYFAAFAGPLAAIGLALVAVVPVARRLPLRPAFSGVGLVVAVVGGVGLGVGLLVVAGGDVDLPRLLLGAAAGAALVSGATAAGGRAWRREGPWGVDLAHAGLGLLLLGVAGTATGTTETVPIEPGGSVDVLGQTVEYRGVAVVDGSGATLASAGRPPNQEGRAEPAAGTGTGTGTGTVSRAGPDRRAAGEPASVVADVRAAGQSLSPSLVAYPARGVLLAETSLVSTPLRDVQVALRDAGDDGSAVLEIGVHPLQVLVWWGGLVIVAAGLVVAYQHRRTPTGRTATASDRHGRRGRLDDTVSPDGASGHLDRIPAPSR